VVEENKDVATGEAEKNGRQSGKYKIAVIPDKAEPNPIKRSYATVPLRCEARHH
jgi:hypothetical protein